MDGAQVFADAALKHLIRGKSALSAMPCFVLAIPFAEARQKIERVYRDVAGNPDAAERLKAALKTVARVERSQ